MVIFLKANSKMIKKMGLVLIDSQTAQFSRAIISRASLKVMGPLNGPTENTLTANGKMV